jgi:hypothetical protein
MTIPMWMQANAWREIFARAFENWPVQVNISPEWLINPETHRRLKLDLFYPDAQIAVRFEGIQPEKRKARPSLEEEEQQRARETARVEVCREHGVHLLLLDAASEEIADEFLQVDLILSQAQRALTDVTWQENIKTARFKIAQIGRPLTQINSLKTYADLWEDRQFQMALPQENQKPAAAPTIFTVGMDVNHQLFGLGTILQVEPSASDVILTVDFLEAGKKMFAASLVADKLNTL